MHHCASVHKKFICVYILDRFLGCLFCVVLHPPTAVSSWPSRGFRFLRLAAVLLGGGCFVAPQLRGGLVFLKVKFVACFSINFITFVGMIFFFFRNIFFSKKKMNDITIQLADVKLYFLWLKLFRIELSLSFSLQGCLASRRRDAPAKVGCSTRSCRVSTGFGTFFFVLFFERCPTRMELWIFFLMFVFFAHSKYF